MLPRRTVTVACMDNSLSGLPRIDVINPLPPTEHCVIAVRNSLSRDNNNDAEETWVKKGRAVLLSESESSIYESVIMRSRGERVSITSWCMPDNGRASGGSLTVRLKQHVHPQYPSRYPSDENGCHRESLLVYTRRGNLNR
ncbi:hypothetical protein ALC62_05099 [Cyphomyrmex costatus]|uniref:Uncharacterized protein n=1 Tax=Cyphomyrmex costatus TaxID=456900 RepID=A0A195CUH5_9HYME|nr:hypothetical protein ALC62_05099 [Cyphomyrmex costatus]